MAIVRSRSARQVPAYGVVWAGAGALALSFTAYATANDLGVVALGLVLTALAGSLIVIRPEFGVIALTSTFFLSYPEMLQGSGSLTINNVLGLFLAAILLIRIALSRRVEGLFNATIGMLVVVAAVTALNGFLSDSTPTFAHLAGLDLTDRRIQEAITKTAFVVFVAMFIRTRWQVVLLASTVVLFVVMTAPNAILNALTAEGQIEKIRASADFGIVAARNANRLAFVCATAIAIIGYAMLAIDSVKARVAGSLTILLLIVAVFLSGSRSGLLNLVMLAILFGARLGIRLRTAMIGILTAAFVISAVIAFVPASVIESLGGPESGVVIELDRHAQAHGGTLQKYVNRLTALMISEDDQSGAAGSTRARLELLETAARMSADNPFFGVGIGNFRWVSVVDYSNRHLSAMHNSYAVTMVEGGLTLLVPYLLLFWLIWKTLARTAAQAARLPAVRLEWLVAATRAIFLMFLVFSVFAEMWHEIYLYLIVGLSLVLARLYNAADAQPS
jgi:hypothetical protein